MGKVLWLPDAVSQVQINTSQNISVALSLAQLEPDAKHQQVEANVNRLNALK
jgi:hypothetical protein